MTPVDVLAYIKAKDVKTVDFKFCDIYGSWLHITIPVSRVTETTFKNGLEFDARSVRGWKDLDNSHMLLIPDPTTIFIDPFIEVTTLSLICDIIDPITRGPYDHSPREIAKRTEAYVKSTGIADALHFGPEPEFFIFDDIHYSFDSQGSFTSVDSEESIWKSGEYEQGGANLGYKIRLKEGYLAAPPSDKTMDIRNDMMMTMIELGLHVEGHHHAQGSSGQGKIDIRHNTLLAMADDLCLYKYIVKNVALQNGKTATFMPKPIFGDNSSSMHINTSLWKNKKSLMNGDLYGALSQKALWFIGGILKHAPALCAICNPTNNSYKRLVPSYQAPVSLSYSNKNCSAICHVPPYCSGPNSKRIELQNPDPSANPYLAFSAIAMAGLDGIENKIDPGEPLDNSLCDLSTEKSKISSQLPDSLRGAIRALENNHDFLLKGGVFSKDFIDNFIKVKMLEYDAIRLRPHPYEFHLYYDV